MASSFCVKCRIATPIIIRRVLVVLRKNLHLSWSSLSLYSFPNQFAFLLFLLLNNLLMISQELLEIESCFHSPWVESLNTHLHCFEGLLWRQPCVIHKLPNVFILYLHLCYLILYENIHVGNLILSRCENWGVLTQLLNSTLIAAYFSKLELVLSDLTQYTSLKLRLLLSKVGRRSLITIVKFAKMLEELFC